MNWNIAIGTVLLAVGVLDIVLFWYFSSYEKTIAIRSYLAFIAGVALWVFGNGATYLIPQEYVMLAQRFGYVGGTILTSAFLVFVYAFPYPRTYIATIMQYIGGVFTAVSAVLFLFTDLIIRRLEFHNGSLTTQFSTGLVLWSFAMVIMWTLALAELMRNYVGAEGMLRRRLRYLLIGIVISLFVGITSDVILPLTGSPSYPMIGSLFSVVWLWFTVKAVRA